jgi:hypothetical protein
MKTKDEIRRYAEGLAWGHFYSETTYLGNRSRINQKSG